MSGLWLWLWFWLCTKYKRKKAYQACDCFLNLREKEERISGAQTWNRTRDTRIFNPLLYRLSYLSADRNFRNALNDSTI